MLNFMLLDIRRFSRRPLGQADLFECQGPSEFAEKTRLKDGEVFRTRPSRADQCQQLRLRRRYIRRWNSYDENYFFKLNPISDALAFSHSSTDGGVRGREVGRKVWRKRDEDREVEN